MSPSLRLRLRRGLATAAVVLGAIRCAPEYRFPSDADGGAASDGPAHCANGRRDADLGEVRVDCGGECPPCARDCLQGTRECDGDPTKVCETNVLTSAENCGACGEACELPHALASCSGGKCQAALCERPYANCDDVPENGCEVDLSTSVTDCGACNEPCSDIHGTPACQSGSCVVECDASWDDCNRRVSDGCETSVTEDVRNCGECGSECVPESGETAYCKTGECGSSRCEAGFGDCDGDGQCSDALDTDSNNCGYCGRRCLVSNGLGKCVDGECQVAECDPGFADCDTGAADGGYGTGCEANTRSGIRSCGGCGNECSVENGVPRCVAGECRASTCTPPFADCDGDGKSCETDTRSDTLNCGGCAQLGGVNCEVTFGTNDANGRCDDGRCVFDGCRPGFGDCNNDELACEADVRSDPDNCGGCEVACAVGEGTMSNACSDAACKPACARNYRNCNGDGTDGCEANVLTDAQNCGTCGAVCDTTGAVKNVCDGGKCVPTCIDVAGDCDGVGANGCETDITSTALHCGACGFECRAPRGTTSTACADGECVPACEPGRGDCDGRGENGCEANVSDDDLNCGACKRDCKSGAGTNAITNFCEGTECRPTCASGWGACDDADLGCTTSLDSAEYCGSCTNRCAGAQPSCVEGRCQARIGILQNAQAGGESSTLSFELELTAGQNRVLFLAVTGRSMKGNGAFEQGKPEAVRFGSVNVPLFAELNGGDGPSNSAGQNHLFFYALGEQQLTALGSGKKRIEVVANTPQRAHSLAANAILFSGVRQDEPFGDAQSRTLNENCKDDPPNNQPRDTLVVGEGTAIYSLVAAQHTGPESGAPMPIARTLEFSRPTGSNVTHHDVAVQGGHIGVNAVLPNGMQTFTWTYDSCSNWTLLSVAIQPARQ